MTKRTDQELADDVRDALNRLVALMRRCQEAGLSATFKFERHIHIASPEMHIWKADELDAYASISVYRLTEF